MSYDVYLKESTTDEMASVPSHLMCGGTYKVEYDPETNRFVQALNTDAHIITVRIIERRISKELEKYMDFLLLTV